MHYSTKTYPHSTGLSCCFRQWGAKSHCRFMHGYALSVSLKFEADVLDENGWVMDFGALKPVKDWLEHMFDHKTIVAKNDPSARAFIDLEKLGLAQVTWVERTGCEAFALMIFKFVQEWLVENYPNVRINQVTVAEHEGNSAIVDRNTAGTGRGASETFKLTQ